MAGCKYMDKMVLEKIETKQQVSKEHGCLVSLVVAIKERFA